MGQQYVYAVRMGESVFKRMMRWAENEGWDQTDLANRLGVSPQNVTNWKGRGVPPAKHAEIAALFGRSVDQLLGKAPEQEGLLRAWPYPSIDEQKFRSLRESDSSRLEAIVLLGAAQIGVDIKKES